MPARETLVSRHALAPGRSEHDDITIVCETLVAGEEIRKAEIVVYLVGRKADIEVN